MFGNKDENKDTKTPGQTIIGRKVKSIRVHQATNINGNVKQGIGQKTEDAGIEMTVVQHGVLMTFKTKDGKTTERLIFSNNVYEADLI